MKSIAIVKTMTFLVLTILAIIVVSSLAKTDTCVVTKLKDIYCEEFDLTINYPSYFYTSYGAESFWVSTAYIQGQLYVIKSYDDCSYDARESWLYAASNLKPCGEYTILIIVIDCQNTNIGDLLETLSSSIDEVNQMYEGYSNSLGLTSPILKYYPTIVHVPTTLNAEYFNELPYDQLLLEIREMSGNDPTEYDMWCLAVFDATDAPKGCMAIPSLRFVRMNMYWIPDGDAYDEIGIDQINGWIRCLFTHEVYHLYGWEHFWGGSDIPDLRIAPELFGWVDIDGDGIIEILDPDPYYGGRSPSDTFVEDFLTTEYMDDDSSYTHTLTGWGSGTISLPRDMPSFLGFFGTVGSADRVFVSGDYAYVTEGSDGLEAIDVSDPANPTLVMKYTNCYANDVFVLGNNAYIADGENGLKVINLEGLLWNFNFGGSAIAVFVLENYAYIVDMFNGLVVIDIIGGVGGIYEIPSVYANSVFVLGDYAYVTEGSDGLIVIDVTDPTDPQPAGYYNTEGSANSVFVSGRYAYIADGLNGLIVIDVSDPPNPRLNKRYETSGSANDVFVSGDYAYIADGEHGLEIVLVRLFSSSGQTRSSPILNTNHNIISATLSSVASVPEGTAVNYFLSANNGDNWVPVTPEIEQVFTAGQIGTELRWKVEMTTSDPTLTPTISEITIQYTISNAKPVADPFITFEASFLKHVDAKKGASNNFILVDQGYDPDGDPRTWCWSIISKPLESSAVIENPSLDLAQINNLDLPGYYLIRLVVNDGYVDSIPAYLTFQIFDTGRYDIHMDSNVESFDTDHFACECADVWVTLMEVNAPGVTTIDVSETMPDPPSGFDLISSYYDVSTSTSFNGPAIVAIKSELVAEGSQLLHYEEGSGWVDVTILPVDVENNIIAGRVSSLSSFVVGMKQSSNLGENLLLIAAVIAVVGIVVAAIVFIFWRRSARA